MREKIFKTGVEDELLELGDDVDVDTPLPPLTRAAWVRLCEKYPKPTGVIGGKNAALRIFVKTPGEWNRWLQNADNYAGSRRVANGYVQDLDNWLRVGYKDFDKPETPSGGGPGPPIDNSLFEQQDEWRRECEEYDRKVAAGEITEPPRKKPEWKTSN